MLGNATNGGCLNSGWQALAAFTEKCLDLLRMVRHNHLIHVRNGPSAASFITSNELDCEAAVTEDRHAFFSAVPDGYEAVFEGRDRQSL